MAMASLKLALLLFSGLQCSALTSGFEIKALPDVWSSQTATGDTCQDCTQIVELLVGIISDADIQRSIMDSLEIMCDHLPEPSHITKLCRDQVEKMVPVAITFIAASLKPSDVCGFLGLCHSRGPRRRTPLLGGTEERPEASGAGEELPTAQCRYCMILIKTLESLLPREKAEGAVVQLLEEACGVLPGAFRGECKALMDAFGKTLLDTLARHATPQALCGLVRLCKGRAGPFVGEAFRDPCAAASFRCRDVLTAIQCGTLPYCQKFAWRSPADRTL